VGDAAQILEQATVEAEVRAQHLWNSECEVTMGDREKDCLVQKGSEKLDLLLMTRRTPHQSPAGTVRGKLHHRPSCPGVAQRAKPDAGERKEVFVLTMVAADAGETLFQVAAVQKFVHHIRDDWAQEAIAWLIPLFIDGEERTEITRQALPER